MADATPREPLAPDLATRVTEFARACKAAARAFSMYPDGHQAVRSSVTRLVGSIGKATESGALTLTVLNGRLVVNGAEPERPDQALGELATLLHGHLVGELVVEAPGDTDSWQAFLKLLARPAEEVRGEGGIAKVFTGTGIGIRELDYSEILKERAGGPAASLDSLVSSLLEAGDGSGDGPGDAALEALVEAAGDADQLRELASLLNSRTAEVEPAQQAETVLKLLRGLVKSFEGKPRDEILQTLQRMTPMMGELSADAMTEMLEQWKAASSIEGSVNIVEATVGQMGDDDVARFVAGSVEAESGSTERLAQAFQALVPEGERRKQVLAVAEQHTADSELGQSESFPALWNNVERMLTSYSDEPYVSTDYARELSAAGRKAVEVDQISDDPPERMQAWLDTVADDQLQEMDFQLLLDLLNLEPDSLRWRDIANIIGSQIETLLQEGQFPGVRRLLGPIADVAEATDHEEITPQAKDLIGRLASGRAVKRGFKHVRAPDDDAFDDLKQICARLGSAVIPAVAEALAGEDDAKGRRRLRGILTDFGDQAIASMHELMQSPSPEVRRTAMLLLRELGGAEALDAIEPMLTDSDPKIRRQALRSMLVINKDRAHGRLLELVTSNDAACVALTDELGSVRDDRAAPLCGLLVGRLDHRTHTELYLSAVEALGRLGDPDQVAPLKAALYRGEWWAPVRTRTLRTAAAEALRKIGVSAAAAILREAANEGPRRVRAVARRAHARLESGQ